MLEGRDAKKLGVISKMGGRKFVMLMATLLCGTLFGVYCVKAGVALGDAGLYWGAVSVGPLGYGVVNVAQKHVSAKHNHVGGGVAQG